MYNGCYAGYLLFPSPQSPAISISTPCLSCSAPWEPDFYELTYPCFLARWLSMRLGKHEAPTRNVRVGKGKRHSPSSPSLSYFGTLSLAVLELLRDHTSKLAESSVWVLLFLTCCNPFRSSDHNNFQPVLVSGWLTIFTPPFDFS